MMRSSVAPRFMGRALSRGSHQATCRSEAMVSSRRAPASSSRSSTAVDRERDRPEPDDQRLDPELGPGRRLLPDLLDRPDQPAHPPLRRGSTASSTPGGVWPGAARSAGRGRLRPRRTARRGRATATPSPDRGRPPRTPARARRDARGRRRASRPSRCSSRRPPRPTSASSRSPLPPTKIGGVGSLHRGRLVHAPSSAVVTAVERARPSAEQAATAPAIASREPGQALPRRRHVHADRRVLGLVPPGADADVEPAAADAVEGGERLGEHGGGAERLAEHERAEARARHDRAASAASVDDRIEARRAGRAGRRTSRRRGRGGRTATASRTRRARRPRAYSTIVSQRSGDSPGDRVVVLRQREPEAHRRSLILVAQLRAGVPGSRRSLLASARLASLATPLASRSASPEACSECVPQRGRRA